MASGPSSWARRCVRPKRAVYSRSDGQEGFVLSLALHAQEVGDVDLREHLVELVADRDGPTVEAGRQQRRWRDEGDLGAEHGERERRRSVRLGCA